MHRTAWVGYYEKGKGVMPDRIQAYIWYDLAAAQGLEIAVKNRDQVAAEMAPDEIIKAQNMAREWRAEHPGAN